MLDPAQISQNYQQTLALSATVARAALSRYGRRMDPADPGFQELCQTMAGDERVVKLLQSTRYSDEDYRPLLETVVGDVNRLLFPDVSRRRFSSLDSTSIELVAPAACEDEADVSGNENPELFRELQSALPRELFDYFQSRLSVHFPDWIEKCHYVFSTVEGEQRKQLLAEVAVKVQQFARFYPEGQISTSGTIDASEPLSDEQVVDIYLRICLGIDAGFPPLFLEHSGECRAGILVRTLVERVLESDPLSVLESRDETLFIRHKLQNVYRYFNYSANRALRNAYPRSVPPWLHSRTPSRYWEDADHRRDAVRWLVESRLSLDPALLFRHQPTREQFAANGLSYMFNRYYNSVSRALSEAYPDCYPWELGKVPYHYWTAQRAARAIRWMVERKGWSIEELPERVRNKEFGRNTFSEFGLATLFEKRYSRNLFRAISATWPGKFRPWELGKVPSDYWADNQHVYDASQWIASQEGVGAAEIVEAIRARRLTNRIFRKYSIGAALRRISAGQLERIFAPAFLREAQLGRESQKLLRRLNRLKQHQRLNGVLDYLLHGFFLHDARRGARQNLARYERIGRRVRRRAERT